MPERAEERSKQPLPPLATAVPTGPPSSPGPRARPRGQAVQGGKRAGSRLYVIDGIRLLAALMVVAHHYAGTWRADRPGNLIWGRPVSEVMPTVFRVASYGWIGVERRRDLLRDQRLRDLHVVLGPHTAPVLSLPSRTSTCWSWSPTRTAPGTSSQARPSTSCAASARTCSCGASSPWRG
ncbi:hypothetical protein GCM10022384_58840 [Streptomyces marokkonensis]|uniref:Acyltransferase n=1 Tax=Streptomyces marokkonensis TaxID=324855 RepID=A0ABP7RZI9_9ACTN